MLQPHQLPAGLHRSEDYSHRVQVHMVPIQAGLVGGAQGGLQGACAAAAAAAAAAGVGVTNRAGCSRVYGVGDEGRL